MSIEDRAQEHEAAEWERRNTRAPTTNTYSPEDARYGPEECDDCGAPMPALRRSHGWRLCTACQTIIERARRR